MFPNLLKNQLEKNQYLLYTNTIRLVSKETRTEVVNGTPETVTVETVHWEGKGSIQYVRPRIQKSIADETAGTMEDAISVVAYVPYVADPHEGMSVVDVDGATGQPGQAFPQSRAPANVGGASVYWELYLGGPVNV